MGLIIYIARRYLFSRKSTHVINIISGISVFGILFCTAALIILLSAFNGLENWVIRLYNSVDPELKVLPVNEKFFRADQAKIERIKKLTGVNEVIEVIEENGLITYREAQFICTIKGVGEGFSRTAGLSDKMIAGRFSLERGNQPAALAGSGVAYALSANLNDINNPFELYVPRPGAGFTMNPSEAFHSAQIFPAGFFEVQPEYDSKYLIVPIDFARDLFLRNNLLSHLEIRLDADADIASLREEIHGILGVSFVIKDRFEQHEVLYKIINAEKWAVFLIGMFIVLIAAFNITGTLTMLIVDKSRDVGTLRSLGLTWSRIRKIFFTEGLLVSLSGLAGGILLGSLLVWLQQITGMIKINDYDAYPVDFQWGDYALVSITVIAIGALASWFPSSVVFRRYALRKA